MADSSLPSTERVNPAALAAPDVARLLGVPVAAVEQHLAEGAPQATDGSMNLVHYAAWLLKATADLSADAPAFAEASAGRPAMADKSAEAKRSADGN